jgi:Lrp/AsnC family transcriptional regulator for asnA, asnC and gidA
MNRKILDRLDNDILRLLTNDGRMSVGDMAARLQVSAPTVRSRIKALEESGLMNVSALIDPDRHGDVTVALVGLSIQSYGTLDSVLEKLVGLDNVVWAGVVTGRYDIIAEVVFTGGTAELYRFTTEIIPRIGMVARSETFVIMKSKKGWLRIPASLGDL